MYLIQEKKELIRKSLLIRYIKYHKFSLKSIHHIFWTIKTHPYFRENFGGKKLVTSSDYRAQNTFHAAFPMRCIIYSRKNSKALNNATLQYTASC
jgi:hypothetical protein